MKISASCYWLEKKYGYKKAFQMMKDAGFDAVDFGIDDWIGSVEELKQSPCYRMSIEELGVYYTNVYEAAKELGIEIAQTHAVFGPAVTRSHPALFKEVTEKSIYVTSLLHCKHIVVHPVATPGRIYDEAFEECFAFNHDFFAEFFSRQCQLIFSLNDFQRTDFCAFSFITACRQNKYQSCEQ